MIREIKKVIVFVLLLAFLGSSCLAPPIAKADPLLSLPKPGTMVHLSPAFTPALLKGIKVHPENPFRFDFILDKGESKVNDQALKDETTKLIKYFLTSLTVPEKDLWVNLSPFEKNRIVPQSFGQTDMGRDLLAQDYLLKQITATLIYPEDKPGKEFWKRIYTESAEKFRNTTVPVSTFNKVWIMPDKAKVYEHGNTAFVVKSKLKVMLEEDYLALDKNTITNTAQKQSTDDVHALASQIVREVVVPQLEKEVNEGKNFAPLRQAYNSLILAVWFKKRMKDSVCKESE